MLMCRSRRRASRLLGLLEQLPDAVAQHQRLGRRPEPGDLHVRLPADHVPGVDRPRLQLHLRPTGVPDRPMFVGTQRTRDWAPADTAHALPFCPFSVPPAVLQFCLPSANISLVADLKASVTSMLNSRGISIDVYSNLYQNWKWILAYVAPTWTIPGRRARCTALTVRKLVFPWRALPQLGRCGRGHLLLLAHLFAAVCRRHGLDDRHLRHTHDARLHCIPVDLLLCGTLPPALAPAPRCLC